ncbi:MAG: oxidoreductase, partial [Vicinamibacteria bacterium]
MAYLAILTVVLGATPQKSGVSVRLQAVSAVENGVVWVSGLEGTYVRSLDSGDSWQPGVVPGAEKLELRDVHAVDDKT